MGHLAAASGPIPVSSVKSFILAIENANCSSICRERSSGFVYICVCLFLCVCHLKAAVIPGASHALVCLYL